MEGEVCRGYAVGESESDGRDGESWTSARARARVGFFSKRTLKKSSRHLTQHLLHSPTHVPAQSTLFPSACGVRNR